MRDGESATRRAWVPVLAGALLLAAAAADAASRTPTAPLLTVEARLQAAAEKSGTLSVRARLASGWHVNSHTPTEDYLIPTSVVLQSPAGVTAGEPRYPQGVLEKFSFADKPLSVYKDQFTIEIPLSWSAEAPKNLTGKVEFQACNDRQCLAPASVSFEVSEVVRAAGGFANGALALSQAPARDRAAATAGSGDFAELISRRGLFVALLFVFGWGLALNLTPCVYPVIPLTISFFGGQAAGQPRRIFGLAGLYVLGMATMYSALGVAAALSGKLFGAALQSPWVLAGIAAVLVLLALSMFGLYEIRMPSAWMQKAGSRAGAAGAYGMGLLVGVVAAPCIGPVVLALLTFVASRQDAAFGFLIFFVLSLGLGLPYLFLAAFSGSLARLPRAGAWMEGIKKVFGWILLAMAAYFVRNVIPPAARPWLLPAILAAGALWLALAERALRPALRVVAALFFVAAAFFFAPRRAPVSDALNWSAYSVEAVGRVARPTIIDFSAAWCVPCRELDEKTFSDSRVRRALSARALFKADLTESTSPEALALAQKYGILGVPTIIFLDPQGNEDRDLRLVGFEGPDQFLARLQKAP